MSCGHGSRNAPPDDGRRDCRRTAELRKLIFLTASPRHSPVGSVAGRGAVPQLGGGPAAPAAQAELEEVGAMYAGPVTQHMNS